MRRRGDSALEPALGPAKTDPWDQSLLGWLDAKGVGCAISADTSRELWRRRAGLGATLHARAPGRAAGAVDQPR